jgi:hypothetical protein
MPAALVMLWRREDGLMCVASKSPPTMASESGRGAGRWELQVMRRPRGAPGSAVADRRSTPRDTPDRRHAPRDPQERIIKTERFQTFSRALRASVLWRDDFGVGSRRVQ